MDCEESEREMKELERGVNLIKKRGKDNKISREVNLGKKVCVHFD